MEHLLLLHKWHSHVIPSLRSELALSTAKDPQERGSDITPKMKDSHVILSGSAGSARRESDPALPLRMTWAETIEVSLEQARAYILSHIAEKRAEQHRQGLRSTLPSREMFIEHGFTYQAAELAQVRTHWTERANAGDSRAKGELTKIKARQKGLQQRKAEALAVIRREPELIVPGDVTFLAHALVLPSNGAQERRRYDASIEAIAVNWARAFEEALGASVRDVSTPQRALEAGLDEWPGFDLLSRRPSGEELAIEVKGRAGIGEVELSENEYIKACNLRDRYWLYVVFECAKAVPRLLRIQDPFGKLIVRAIGNVVIDDRDIFTAAEPE